MVIGCTAYTTNKQHEGIATNTTPVSISRMNPLDANPLQYQSPNIIVSNKRKMDHYYDTDSITKRGRSTQRQSQSTRLPVVPTALLGSKMSSANAASSKRKQSDSDESPWKAMKRLKVVEEQQYDRTRRKPHTEQQITALSSSLSDNDEDHATSSTTSTVFTTPHHEPRRHDETTATMQSQPDNYHQVNHVLGSLHLERHKRNASSKGGGKRGGTQLKTSSKLG